MAIYRSQSLFDSGKKFLTDGGLETYMVFDKQQELPCFAAISLMDSEIGQKLLRDYCRKYLDIARNKGVGFILGTPTWRAHPAWASKLNYSEQKLRNLVEESVVMMEELRKEFETESSPIVISTDLGPRGDGYVPSNLMTIAEAESHHAKLIEWIAPTAVDLVTGLTLNYVEEAIGLARASQQFDMPVVISFTVETNGKLPTGDTIAEAISRIDTETKAYPQHYMINCAHPTHFQSSITELGELAGRIRGIRANASKCSHAELDEADELDNGNPIDLSQDYKQLISSLDKLIVLGGCCGTDHRHIAAISENCL